MTTQTEGLTAAVASPVRLHTVYYDTPDLRIARAGFSLRHRSADGWTLEVPFDREELDVPDGELRLEGDPAAVPAQARALLRSVIRERPLIPVAELRSDDITLRIAGPARRRRIDAGQPQAALLSFSLASRIRDVLRYDFLIRLRAEPEDVHRARSAVRKLRAVLRAFRTWLDRPWVDSLREELRWFAGELGTVRDVDVALAALRERAQAVALPDSPFIAEALGPIANSREAMRRRLFAALAEPRYLQLLDRLDAASAAPRFVEGSPQTAGDLAERTLRRLSKRVRNAVQRAREEHSPNELHHARIQVRNGRYAAEACAAVAGKRAKRLARRLAKMQDVLGAINDAAFVQDRLRATVGDARAMLVAGQLIALEAAEGEKARIAWKSLRIHALREDWIDI